MKFRALKSLRPVPRWLLPLHLAVAASGCGSTDAAPVDSPSRFLYVWAGDVDGNDSDFLAVIDVRSDSKTMGQCLR